MYCEGLRLSVLSSFRDHDGFDGIMMGLPGADYHLEFTTCANHATSSTPDPEDLLVFYYPSHSDWTLACSDMSAAGFEPVCAINPYWDVRGRTYRDLDGYHVVLQQEAWAPPPCASS
jgi:hypothetical protein